MGALRLYCKTESMPDYKCTNCQQKGGCAKSMSIQTLPQTLCLHLKRFEADEVAKDINLNKDAQHTNGHGQSSNKIDGHVEFPVDEWLDLADFVNKKEENKKYKLRAIICHSGVLDAGRYVACIRKDDRWYYCDDDKVYNSTVDLVKQTDAYMLFYEAQ